MAPQPMHDESSRFWERQHQDLTTRLYGGYGVQGDVPAILEKLQELRDGHMRMRGVIGAASVLIPLVVVIIQHYWRP